MSADEAAIYALNFPGSTVHFCCRSSKNFRSLGVIEKVISFSSPGFNSTLQNFFNSFWGRSSVHFSSPMYSCTISFPMTVPLFRTLRDICRESVAVRVLDVAAGLNNRMSYSLIHNRKDTGGLFSWCRTNGSLRGYLLYILP